MAVPDIARLDIKRKALQLQIDAVQKEIQTVQNEMAPHEDHLRRVRRNMDLLQRAISVCEGVARVCRQLIKKAEEDRSQTRIHHNTESLNTELAKLAEHQREWKRHEGLEQADVANLAGMAIKLTPLQDRLKPLQDKMDAWNAMYETALLQADDAAEKEQEEAKKVGAGAPPAYEATTQAESM